MTDLPRENFTLLEDGRPQRLYTFGSGAELPLQLGLMIDISRSMDSAMPLVKKAAEGFLGQLMSTRDQSFLVVFRDRPFLAQPSTGDLDLLTRSVEGLGASGSTALWDSMVFSLLEFAGMAGRKALVVLTDGVDLESHFGASDAVQMARRTGVPVYVIGMTGNDGKGPWQHRASLRRLADSTGAHLFFIAGAGELAATYATIAEELRSQYVLAFQSDQPADEAGWRALRLEVDRPGLVVRSVSGYWASP